MPGPPPAPAPPQATVHQTPEATPQPHCSIAGTAPVVHDATQAATIHLSRLEHFVAVQHWERPADSEGRFAFNELSPGWYRVSAFAPGAVPGTARTWACTAGQAHAVELPLVAGQLAVSGTLLDNDGNPVANSTVLVSQVVHRTVLPGGAFIPVNPDGRWSVTLIPGHRYRFAANAPTHLLVSDDRDIGPKDIVFIPLKLAPQPAVTGHAVNEVGDPIHRALLTLGPAGQVTHSQDRSDIHGAFSLYGHFERPMNVGAQADSRFGCTTIPPIPQAQTAPPVKIVMAPGRPVTGRVIDDKGHPVSNDNVEWVDEKCGRTGQIEVGDAGEFSTILPMVPLKMWAKSARLRTPVTFDATHIELRGSAP